jgi:hypothetical protein
MKSNITLFSLHLNYLTPLTKWRVMDLESLRMECNRETKYKNFHRVIRNLEKEKILEGYRDPHTRKKFVYFSQIGESKLCLQENPTALATETMIHDSKVSEITRYLFANKWIDEVELEHQINNKRNFKSIYKIIPDAIIYTQKNGHRYNIAFELELTRKSNDRLIDKMKLYESSSFYHYVMYFFPSINLMNQYLKQAEEKIGLNLIDKFMFFYHPKLTLDQHKPEEISGWFKGKKITLADVLKK